MTTEEKFNAAVNVIRSLPKNGSYQPSNELMLRFYAYFKQATQGPCKGARPAFWDLVSRAKYDAWKKLGDMSKQQAMTCYVDELHTIVETMSYSDKVANFLDAPSHEVNKINMADLELIAGDVIEKVRSRSNSPLASRDTSPQRLHSNLGSSLSSSSDSDHSDGEYVDTIESPEPRRPIANGYTGLVNGLLPKEHKSRSKSKSVLHDNVDISQEISRVVQTLRNDIQYLMHKVNVLENTKNSPQNVQKSNSWTLGIKWQLFAFIAVWPFVVSFILNRLTQKRRI